MVIVQVYSFAEITYDREYKDLSIIANGKNYYKFTLPKDKDFVVTTVTPMTGEIDVAFTLYSDAKLETSIDGEIDKKGANSSEAVGYQPLSSGGTYYLVISEKSGKDGTYAISLYPGW
ncbi:hypothetical protein [Spirochaeta cellobiosiphila]|uniref:hypothetical protein n=1 Tax=Spirochaeta cellobiosiphila TaxID=504483 RepID=UPI001B7F7DE3|nr:hypothetical protein [Spirochaeta cellobiosiphila]